MGDFNTGEEYLELLRAYFRKFFKLELMNVFDKPTTQGKSIQILLLQNVFK